MTYALLDDSFYDAPSFAGAPNECIGVWAKGLAYCNRHLTDGFIPDRVAVVFLGRVDGSQLEQNDPEKLLAEMLNRQFWSRRKGGFAHVGYLDHNPSKAQVLARRASARDRKGRWKQGPLERVPGTRSERVLGTHPNPIRSNPIQSDDQSLREPASPALSTDEQTRIRAISKPPANANRGTRLIDGWGPTQVETPNSWHQIAREKAFSPDHVRDLLSGFRTYWAAQRGSKGQHVDWEAVWRNWLRRESPYRATGGYQRPLLAKQQEALPGEYDWSVAARAKAQGGDK